MVQESLREYLPSVFWSLLSLALGFVSWAVLIFAEPDPYGLHRDESSPVWLVLGGILFTVGGGFSLCFALREIIRRPQAGGICSNCNERNALVDLNTPIGLELLKDSEKKRVYEEYEKRMSDRRKEEEAQEKKNEAIKRDEILQDTRRVFHKYGLLAPVSEQDLKQQMSELAICPRCLAITNPAFNKCFFWVFAVLYSMIVLLALIFLVNALDTGYADDWGVTAVFGFISILLFVLFHPYKKKYHNCKKCGYPRSLVKLISPQGQKAFFEAKSAIEKMEQEETRAEKEAIAQQEIDDKEWFGNPNTSKLVATYRNELPILYQKLQVLHTKRTAQLTSHQASEDMLARRGGNSSLSALASLSNWTLGELEDAQIQKDIEAIEADIKEHEETIARYDRLKVKYQVTDAAKEAPVSDAGEKSDINFCPKCGTRRQAGENFCSKCGNKF